MIGQPNLITVPDLCDLRFLRNGHNGNGHALPALTPHVVRPVTIYTDQVIVQENKGLADVDERWVARTAGALRDVIKSLMETNRRKDAATLCNVLADHVSFYSKGVSRGRSEAIESALVSARNALSQAKARTQIDQATRFRIFTRDGFRCQYCGCGPEDQRLTIDHRVAVTNGGNGDDENLVTACLGCNQGKADTILPTEEAHQ